MQENPHWLESLAIRATQWVGSVGSLVVHTIIFGGAILLIAFGVSVERVLLVLTTIVSLEAIYLSIFIQMSVNRNEARLNEVSKDVDEIQEDVEHIEEHVGEIERDIDEIQEDVESIEKDIDEIQEDVEHIEQEKK